MSDSQAPGETQQSEGKRGILATTGVIVAIAISVVTAAGGFYELGKKIGSDTQNAICEKSSADLQASLDKLSVKEAQEASRANALEQNLSQWKTAYENDQKIIQADTAQIATLTMNARQVDMCGFLQGQITDLQRRLDEWNLNEQTRAELIARRDGYAKELGQCIR
ncbi:MAG: hypothetical protein LBV73_12470 [Paraburkholderia sp.]|jgi:uncharacterized protein YlxW (UPF0749 family)|nr:hypothetical protein [Paraburkholderia sp.]